MVVLGDLLPNHDLDDAIAVEGENDDNTRSSSSSAKEVEIGDGIRFILFLVFVVGIEESKCRIVLLLCSSHPDDRIDDYDLSYYRLLSLALVMYHLGENLAGRACIVSPDTGQTTTRCRRDFRHACTLSNIFYYSTSRAKIQEQPLFES
jgi:hypothetical protein